MKTQIRRTMIIGLIASLATTFAYADDGAGHQKTCANASLLGSFGFYRTGTTGAGPLAAVGIIHFDGYATIGSQSISRNGVIQHDLPIAGTYEVAADCTGKFYMPDGTEIARVVVVDDGNEFLMLSESAGNSVYGVARRIGGD
jgi:hypothetical protein